MRSSTARYDFSARMRPPGRFHQPLADRESEPGRRGAVPGVAPVSATCLRKSCPSISGGTPRTRSDTETATCAPSRAASIRMGENSGECRAAFDSKLVGGIDLMAEIPELSDLPVILISGYGRDKTIARAFEAGARRTGICCGFEIREHGPLPMSFLLAFTKDTHRSERRRKERLTDLFITSVGEEK